MVSLWVAKQWQHLKNYKYLGLEESVVDDGLRDIVSQKMKLDYLVTGSWSLKASQEAARLVGSSNINIVTDARKHHSNHKFGLIPPQKTWTPTQEEADCVLTYYCDNETVDGVEFPPTPNTLRPQFSRRHVVQLPLAPRECARARCHFRWGAEEYRHHGDHDRDYFESTPAATCGDGGAGVIAEVGLAGGADSAGLADDSEEWEFV